MSPSRSSVPRPIRQNQGKGRRAGGPMYTAAAARQERSELAMRQVRRCSLKGSRRLGGSAATRDPRPRPERSSCPGLVAATRRSPRALPTGPCQWAARVTGKFRGLAPGGHSGPFVTVPCVRLKLHYVAQDSRPALVRSGYESEVPIT
jgi:hypothetical protein